MLVNLFLLSFIALTRVELSIGGNCIRHHFDGQNSFVCVCDLNACPAIDPVPPVPRGHIYQWTSSQTEYRLNRNEIRIQDLIAADQLRPSVTINLNLTDRRQRIVGFGSSFQDAAGFNLLNLSIDLRDHIMMDYFSEFGLSFSLVRVPIGGTDFSIRPYTYDDHAGDFDLHHFDLSPEDTSLKIPMIKRAQELRADGQLKLIATCWSPPGWMKTNDSVVGGYIKGSPGEKFYKTYAKYHVKFLDHYASNGLSFWGITTTNEPVNVVTGADFPLNSIGMTAEMLRDFVKRDLGPSLRDSGYGVDKLNVLIYDDGKGSLPIYAETILSDPEASKFVTGISFHWYNKDGEPPYDNLVSTHERFPNHFLISTEASQGYKDTKKSSNLGNWTQAEEYAYDIIQDLQRHVTGWIDWSFAINIIDGGPSWSKNQIVGVIATDPEKDAYYRNPMYYVLGHFSKFIPPDSVYIGHEIQGDSNGVSCVSFIDPSQQMVIVLLNINDHRVDLIINNYASVPVPISMDSHSVITLVTPSP